jgi:two-component system response regulator NreC
MAVARRSSSPKGHRTDTSRSGEPSAAAETTPLRILLADDHVIFRQGIRTLLERHGFEIVAEAGDGREAIQLAKEVNPDVAILDLAMPHLSGPEAAQQIAQVSPKTRAIMLTMYSEESNVAKALDVGITGYVLKIQSAADLVQAIRDVMAGGIYLSPGISQSIVKAYLARHQLTRHPLTVREQEVLRLVAEGHTTREVAQALGISAKTAESHRMRIMAKLDIHDTAGLVRFAIRQGLIQA